MSDYQLITADVMNWLNLANRYGYKQNYYHALLLDPPYHLTSVVKRFGKGEPKHTKTYADIMGRKTPIGRLAKGFMGQTWDGGDLVFNPELWIGLKERLLPGAFCFAFAGSRGWHRMAVAIEDAGFIMHPTIFLWAYGSGFPKATRIDTQIDKAVGIEREKIGERKQSQGPESMFRRKVQSTQGYRPEGKEFGQLVNDSFDITAPATPEAAQWQSHRYGLQAIKPSVEPILCFQKPYEGKPLDSIVKTGAGALNIDGGRVGTTQEEQDLMKSKMGTWSKPDTNNTYGKGLGQETAPPSIQGRWPSNLLLQHHPDCKRAGVKRVRSDKNTPRKRKKESNPYHLTADNFDNNKPLSPDGYADPDGLETVTDWQCVDQCPVKKLDLQAQKTNPNLHPSGQKIINRLNKTGSFQIPTGTSQGYGNDGSNPSRFFFQSHFVYEQIAAADPVRYVAKAGDKERNAGLDKLPDQTRHRVNAGGLENEPRWSPIEVKNPHPTVKPIALTKYLASLLLPPDSYTPRRILVPFAGSSSEMIGALLAGWDEVTGVEMTKKYIPIANARLAWWSKWLKWGQADIDIILEAYKTAHPQQIAMEF